MRSLSWMAVLVCAAGFATAQDGGEAAAKSNIIALEHAWDQALQRQDIKALAQIFDNSLVDIDYDGKVFTKTQYLARVKLNAEHLQQVVAEEMNVQFFGSETAIVEGVYRASGTENGKAYVRHGRFTDTWVLEGKNWICVASSATPILR
jgi:ketosteroid isomerase-like protein